MKTRTIPVLLFAGALVLAGLLHALTVLSQNGGSSPSPAPGGGAVGDRPKASVETVTAETASISETLVLTGTVEPYRVARLASPAEGPVADVRVREGDRVTSGEKLLSIGREKGIVALVRSLRVELEKASENLARTRQLVENNALPGEALDEARAGYEKSRADLVRAEEAAEDHAVFAPWDGVVSQVHVRDGDFASSRMVLFEIYDSSSLVIRTAVPEKYAVAVKSGMRVDIRLDAYPGDVFAGTVERVYPYLDARLRTRSVEILPADPVAMLPGMFARLGLKLKTADNVVVVPQEAIRQAPGEAAVVFVVKNGKAEKRSVETGIEADGRVEIISGAAAGDQVIITGAERLVDGDAVSPVREGRTAGEDDPAGGRR